MRIQIRMSKEAYDKIDFYKKKRFGEEVTITRGYAIATAYEEIKPYINEIDWKKMMNKLSKENVINPTTINFRSDVLKGIDLLVTNLSFDLGEKNIYRSTVIELIISCAIMILENKNPYKELHIYEEEPVKEDLIISKKDEIEAYKLSTSKMMEVLIDITCKKADKRESKIIDSLINQIKYTLLKSDYIKKRYDLLEDMNDNSEVANYFYNRCFKEEIELGKKHGVKFYGDVLCSLATTFGKDNQQGEFESLHNGAKWERSYTDKMNSIDKNIFYMFRNGYQTIENYIFIPLELNKWRGKEDKNEISLPNQGDYFDIFLEITRNWYISQYKNTKNVNEMLNKYDFWFNRFGKGEVGWKNFVNYYFLRSMVNSNYEVKDIFSPPEEYKQSIAPVIGSYHRYGEALPQHTDKPKDSAINFAINSLWIWKQRQEEILNRMNCLDKLTKPLDKEIRNNMTFEESEFDYEEEDLENFEDGFNYFDEEMLSNYDDDKSEVFDNFD